MKSASLQSRNVSSCQIYEIPKMRPHSGLTQFYRHRFPCSSGELDLTLGYRRCRDYDLKDQTGQDALEIRMDPDYVVAVLCDGVSQSFYGHIMAQQLATRFADYLWLHRNCPAEREEIEAVLQSIEQHAQREARTYPIPKDLPPFLRDDLEDARREGSMTVFSAILVDLRLSTAWAWKVGDVCIHIQDESMQWTTIEANTQGRISSELNRRHYLECSRREGVHAVLLNSDGVPGIGAAHHLLTTAENEINGLIDRWAIEDDISLCSLVIHNSINNKTKTANRRNKLLAGEATDRKSEKTRELLQFISTKDTQKSGIARRALITLFLTAVMVAAITGILGIIKHLKKTNTQQKEVHITKKFTGRREMTRP